MDSNILDQKDRDYLEGAVKEAGEILLSYWPGGQGPRKSELEVKRKEDGSVVTTADFASNSHLIAKLQSRFPEIGIISEEIPESHGGVAQEYYWIIDPLDGTSPFSKGEEGFSVLLTLATKTRLITGILFFPVSGEFIIGDEESGSFLNGKKLSVSTKQSLDSSSIQLDKLSLKDFELQEDGPDVGLEAFVSLCSGTCSAVGLKLRTHKSWDIAPIPPVVIGAGGSVTDGRGSTICLDTSEVKIREIIASNGLVHAELLRKLELPKG